jgi:hypothetical protein
MILTLGGIDGGQAVSSHNEAHMGVLPHEDGFPFPGIDSDFGPVLGVAARDFVLPALSATATFSISTSYY